MKKIIFFLLLLSLITVSCAKEDDEDKVLLQNNVINSDTRTVIQFKTLGEPCKYAIEYQSDSIPLTVDTITSNKTIDFIGHDTRVYFKITQLIGKIDYIINIYYTGNNKNYSYNYFYYDTKNIRYDNFIYGTQFLKYWK